MKDLTVSVENIWTYLTFNKELNNEILQKIEENMTYTIQEYVRYRKIYVDFDFSLFDKDRLRYPTGLFSNLIKVLNQNNVTFNLLDTRNYIKPHKNLIVYGKQLRDYQEETVEKSIKAERGIIKIATGGGKTVVAAAIIAKLNLKSLFIVHTIDLLEQAYDELTNMLRIPIGKIGGGICNIEDINVCTIQTLHSALGLKYEAIDEEVYIKEKIDSKIEKKKEIKNVIENCELIIVDEVQHQKANSYVNMMKAAKKSYFRFGMSATPWKYDSTDIILNAYSGKEIVSISASYLIDRGFLVPLKIYFLDPNELPDYKYVSGRFQKVYQKWIVENKDRNNLIVDCTERLLELDKTILITVSRISHGKILQDMIGNRLKGEDVEFIRGEVNKDKRKKLLNSVRDRSLKVLIGSSVADEGLDLPALDSAIIAGGGKSLIKTLQRIGRTLRPYPNKKEAIIVDFYDHLRYLTGQSRKRMKIYNREARFEVYKHF